jgi:hypothetical protein
MSMSYFPKRRMCSGLPEEAEKQGVTLARSGHAEKLAHFQGGGFGA